MDYSSFQIGVIELAGEGTRLTVANVAAKLRVEPARAGEMLARMAREGRLEREVDEGSGVLEFRVRGGALAQPREDQPLAPSQRRRVPVGLALGFFLPGFGLAYTAPWTVVAASSLAFVVGFKLISWIPFLSAFLLPWFLGLFAVASAILGALYTWQYNQTGRRTALRDEPTSPKELLARLKSKA